MNKNDNDFLKYIKNLEKYELPNYNELPEIPLYMEQVVGYINEVLNDLTQDSESTITPFMVNNYVKAKIISSPVEKKYSKDNIGYLIAISILKSVVSMKNMAVLIDIDEKVRTNTNNGDFETLYSLFKKIEGESIKNVVRKVNARVEVIEKASRNNKKNSKYSKEDEEKVNLAYIALRLFIESEVNKLVADNLMEYISKEVLPEEFLKEPKKAAKMDKKKTSVEAKKLADRQRRK